MRPHRAKKDSQALNSSNERAKTSTQPELGESAYLALCFYSGFTALAVELLTIRALAPLMGTSIVATSLTIATVVLSLSFGYFLATRGGTKKASELLARGISLTGLALLFAPIAVTVLRHFVGDVDLQAAILIRVAIASLLGPLLLGGLPCVALGFCSPFIMEGLSARVPDLRKAAAKYFVSGGLGSLLGSLLPNLILIPWLGTVKSYLLLAGTALFIGGWLKFQNSAHRLACVALIGLVTSASAWSLSKWAYFPSGTIASFETRYQAIYVRIGIDEFPNSRVLTYDMGLGAQSVSPNPDLLNRPFYAAGMLPFQRAVLEKKKRANGSGFKSLILGSAGATTSSLASREYGTVLPGLAITNVDLDPKVHEIAKHYFEADLAHSSYVTQDARVFVRTTPEQFDHIAVDVFAKGFYIPSEVLSVEFYRELKRILKPEGIIQVNVVGWAGSDLVRTIVGGLQKSYPYTYLSDVGDPGQTVLANHYVWASESPIDFEGITQQVPKNTELGVGLRWVTRKTQPAPLSKQAGYDDSVSSEILSFKLFKDLLRI